MCRTYYRAEVFNQRRLANQQAEKLQQQVRKRLREYDTIQAANNLIDNGTGFLVKLAGFLIVLNFINQVRLLCH